MKRIGIDLHDTICGYMTRFIELYGYPYKFTGTLRDMYGGSLLDEHFETNNHSKFLRELRPYKNAKNVLWQLIGMNGGEWDPFILTATEPKSQGQRVTMRWWRTWGFPPNIDIIFAGTHEGKVEYLKKNNIKYLIDDLPAVINPAVKMGIEVLVYNSPWNQEVELPHFRAETWNAVAMYLGVKI